MPEEQATIQALRLLTSAAEFDSATGGVNRDAGLYPVIKLITAAVSGRCQIFSSGRCSNHDVSKRV